ncbi:MAG: hypothetical protein IKP51_09990 [Treponema sp.]|nr:hypothetical protein [Treponema sp.]
MNSSVFHRQLKYWVAFAFLLLLEACGLDSFYYLDPPVTDGHISYYTTEDGILRYFSFVTNEESSLGDNDQYFSSSSELVFLGTEVYYKIYTSYSTMVNVENAIDSLNSSSSNYAAAAESLIESRGYKPLKFSHGSFSPLVEAGSSPNNRHVYIRLNDYGSETDYSKGICISNHPMDKYSLSDALMHNGNPVLPRRYINANYGFNFGQDDNNPLPKSGDADVNYSGSPSGGIWYVDMYAVSVGRDTSYSTSYSKVLFLGSTKISESDYQN